MAVLQHKTMELRRQGAAVQGLLWYGSGSGRLVVRPERNGLELAFN